MKILFYQNIVVMGGAERYLLMLLPEIKKRNIEVGFFCTLQKNNTEIVTYFTKHFAQFDIPVHVCKNRHPLSIKAAMQLSKVYTQGNYTIVSLHLIHAEIIGAVSKMLFNRSITLTVTKHGYSQKFIDHYGLDYKKINRFSVSYQLNRFAQYFVYRNFAVSKGLADFYTLSGICKASKMEVIYHGMHEEGTTPVCKPKRFSDKQILIVARLRRFKGHHFLLEAMKLVNETLQDARLVILGIGEETDNLHKLVDLYNLNDNVIFEGFTNDVYAYIHGADVIVAPSIAEPFGLVVLEAYSCGKPVITFDVPAFNENVINKTTGYLVTPYNIRELADRIIYLLTHKDIAAGFGKRGRQLLTEKFSLRDSIEKTVNFFQKCSDKDY